MGSKNTASFPLGKVIGSGDAAYAKYQEQLGTEIERAEGKKYRMVQATNADGVANRKFAYKWTSYASKTVELCGNAEVPCGVQLSDQVSLAAGDLFWLQIGGDATCVVDDAGNIAAGAPVDVTATGEVATQTTEGNVTETVLGYARVTANDNADITIGLRAAL